MNFTKYRQDLKELRDMCEDTVTGELKYTKGRADNIRFVLEEGKPTKFFLADKNGTNLWTGRETIPFKESEWQKFWQITKEVFPLFSVNLKKDVRTSQLAEYNMFFKVRDYFLDQTDDFLLKPGATMLEIGCGYGGVGIYSMSRNHTDYYGIDYCLNQPSLLTFKDKENNNRFVEIKKSGIPKELRTRKYDLIYSSNVFQHITRKQKQQYLNQAAKQLKNTGVLYFDNFNWNKDYSEEITNPCFTTKFFLTETEVETEQELKEMTQQAGLEIILTNPDPYNVKDRGENKPIGYYCKKKQP